MNHLQRALDGQNEWWKYMAVFLVGLVGANVIGAIPLMVVVAMANKGDLSVLQDSANLLNFEAQGIDPNLGLALMVLPFLVGLIMVLFMFKWMHKRTLKEVINGTNKIRWGRFFLAAAVWGVLMGIYLIVDYSLDPANFEVRLNWSKLLPLIVVAVLLIPFQASFEEILFRGYLAQGVGAWTKSRIWAIIIPSILFGLLHSANPEVAEYGFWVVMPQYISFGLLFGIVSVLDDGIEVAMGAHTANNVFAAILITNSASALQTPALLNQLEVNPVKESVMLIVIGVLFLVIMTFIYKWQHTIVTKRLGDLTEGLE